MHSKESRKEAIRNFKERKPQRGAFVIRCTSSGRLWVGVSPNLTAEQNGNRFCLRLGAHLNKTLQQEWNSHGESSFQFEVIERFAEDLHPLELPDLFKARRTHWLAHFNAEPV